MARVIWQTYGYDWELPANTVGDAEKAEIRRVFSCVQFSGLFDGATVKMQVSIDNVNWYDMKDLYGRNVAAPGPSQWELSTYTLWWRPVTIGGTTDTKIKVSVHTFNR